MPAAIPVIVASSGSRAPPRGPARERAQQLDLQVRERVDPRVAVLESRRCSAGVVVEQRALRR